MRRFFVPAFAIILAACQNSGNPDNADISLVIGEQLVLVTTSYVGDRVEWIVIREYAPDDTDAAKRDKRVRFEQGDALVELPDGTTRSLKDSNILFYLNDEGVEAHAILDLLQCARPATRLEFVDFGGDHLDRNPAGSQIVMHGVIQMTWFVSGVDNQNGQADHPVRLQK